LFDVADIVRVEEGDILVERFYEFEVFSGVLFSMTGFDFILFHTCSR